MTERLRSLYARMGKQLSTIQVWGGLIKRRLIKISVVVILIAVGGILLPSGKAAKEEFAEPAASLEQEMLQQMEQEQPPAERPQPPAKAAADALIAYLPADNSPAYEISSIRIRGNQVLTTQKLLNNIPAVFDAAGKYQIPPEPSALYDFRPIQALLAEPSVPQRISARTIQGFTQYLLSIYQRHHYAGIYVYVPSDAFAPEGPIRRGILPVKVLEARVMEVRSRVFDPNNQPARKTYLRPGLVEKWSPAKPGTTLRQKKLNDFLNIMNLNPDRYVAAIISKSSEPNALSVEYNVYEASPWHWFLQMDNSGTKDRQWAPRLGLIHTNVLGFDDQFTAIYQAKPQRNIEDEFSVYGSYDVPLMTPFLRAKVFGAYSEYNSQGLGTFDFLGRGYFYGGQLRIHAAQYDNWFLDVTGSIIQEESRTSPLGIQTSDVSMDMWGTGFELYKTEDLVETFIGFNQLSSYSTSGDFLTVRGSGAADKEFDIYTTVVRHSRYLDPDKVHRLSGSFTWNETDNRLVPSRMTAFGGMYSVRGYDEYEIIADGGILASLQYEYDLIQAQRNGYETDQARSQQEIKPFLRKLAPAMFIDYGKARIEDALPAEDTDQELCSVGGGLLMELGDNFTGIVYAGYPLIATDNTHEGKGRVNAGILIRW